MTQNTRFFFEKLDPNTEKNTQFSSVFCTINAACQAKNAAIFAKKWLNRNEKHVVFHQIGPPLRY